MKSSKRTAAVSRKTSETNIEIKLNLDGTGKQHIATGIPFLDHMLTALAKHGLFDLIVKAKGDLHIDHHHTNEDVGIVLGQAFAKALGLKKGIRRFGFFAVPMDEALVRAVLDISGRPSFHLLQVKKKRLYSSSQYSFHDGCEFLRSFVQHAGINLIVEVVSGEDSHHVTEAMFKALAKSLDLATQLDPRVKDVPSTKGTLE
ncbi:MAG: imidazoleglycerol-phosphate dehydratase [Candidatus Omnitrophica bacterium CG11_big_fil_rev_8_21_14_0_20_45_26]|uniref:Imidazoleglycerol-phosphate dehydratase n=1 Tax=Candidatus Abzuiibacterium crystallinum TaxID=1974748 RepID=A0A2H0LSE7_9BACT|nr:MAG: imidazoleglycerol-phosphate dehydratase [Candidatus Omnitrophica bacterium CG11_big_fil_rev_8_21_14_0_20_45_26]PIW65026.1 MAG: imidazoleglycerol-phosphate dehydratase HisB [Candidatus Omnitrophica bacterium CG12_big_fil_rev_8_21_14_0_65_45_16]